jgi:hypothetical protein
MGPLVLGETSLTGWSIYLEETFGIRDDTEKDDGEWAFLFSLAWSSQPSQGAARIFVYLRDGVPEQFVTSDEYPLPNAKDFDQYIINQSCNK